jgi:hypothetical protein
VSAEQEEQWALQKKAHQSAVIASDLRARAAREDERAAEYRKQLGLDAGTEVEALAATLNDAADPFYYPFDWHEATGIAASLIASGYRKSSDRRPSIVTDAANRVAYFLNWHQGDNDIAADFPSGPSLYASDLQVILNELQASDPSEPRETVIRDSSGRVLDRWVESDE